MIQTLTDISLIQMLNVYYPFVVGIVVCFSLIFIVMTIYHVVIYAMADDYLAHEQAKNGIKKSLIHLVMIGMLKFFMDMMRKSGVEVQEKPIIQTSTVIWTVVILFAVLVIAVLVIFFVYKRMRARVVIEQIVEVPERTQLDTKEVSKEIEEPILPQRNRRKIHIEKNDS